MRRARKQQSFGAPVSSVRGFEPLPNELILHILEFLDPVSRVCFALTCRINYHAILDIFKVTSKKLKDICPRKEDWYTKRPTCPPRRNLNGTSDYERLMWQLSPSYRSDQLYYGQLIHDEAFLNHARRHACEAVSSQDEKVQEVLERVKEQRKEIAMRRDDRAMCPGFKNRAVQRRNR